MLYLFRKERVIRRLQELDAEFLIVPVIFTSSSLVGAAERNGIDTWIYGSDDKRDWDKVRGLGAKALIVDYPADAIGHLYPDADARMRAGAEKVSEGRGLEGAGE